MTIPLTATPMLTATAYAKEHGVTPRTVLRWLDDGLIPGARNLGRVWSIPADAPRPYNDADTAPADIAHMTHVTSRDMTPTVTAPSTDFMPFDLDRLPSFLPIKDVLDPAGRPLIPGAATLLGISPHAIRRNRDYFHAVPFGPNGSLVVPLATIKEIRG